MLLCEWIVQGKDVDVVRRAIAENYVYYLTIDGISSSAIPLGETDLQRLGLHLGKRLSSFEKLYIYSKLHFEIFYNDSDIIRFHVSPLGKKLGLFIIVYIYIYRWNDLLYLQHPNGYHQIVTRCIMLYFILFLGSQQIIESVCHPIFPPRVYWNSDGYPY